jgi:hypothetical protein
VVAAVAIAVLFVEAAAGRCWEKRCGFRWADFGGDRPLRRLLTSITIHFPDAMARCARRGHRFIFGTNVTTVVTAFSISPVLHVFPVLPVLAVLAVLAIAAARRVRRHLDATLTGRCWSQLRVRAEQILDLIGERPPGSPPLILPPKAVVLRIR